MKLPTLSLISCSLLLSIANAQTLEPTYSIDSHKNVAFFAVFGGSSHINWVLNIMDELGSRGHNATFITSDGETRFGQPYSHVKTVSTGPSIKLPKGIITGATNLHSVYPTAFLSKAIGLMTANFESDYTFTKNYFIDNNIDVAVCDHFADSCVEAAKALNIPFIVTSTTDITEDSGAPYINNKFTNLYDPTTEFQSFAERFRNKFINPVRDLYYMLPFIRDMSKRRAALGLESGGDFTEQWKDALKLINAVYGFTAPRPAGPLVELVGPIIPKHYKPLNEDLQNYLDSHQKVAYVAFGQQATPSEHEINLILTALLENIENGSLDGLVWASVHAAGLFPDTVTTTSGKTYQVQDFFNGLNPDIRIVKWAPQTAVLQHPSTAVFVSHGGLGSWYESTYSGTRMIMFPFFGDQPGNSLIIERNKLGGILRYDFTPEQAAAVVKKIADDEDGEIRKNVKRYQALAQIHSEHGAIRGADLVEEVAYTHVNGKLPHRESADRRMSYIKSHNIDLYAALLALIYAGFRVVLFVFKQLFTSKSNKPQKVKNH